MVSALINLIVYVVLALAVLTVAVVFLLLDRF